MHRSPLMPRRATAQADRVLLADLLRNLAVNALHASTPAIPCA